MSNAYNVDEVLIVVTPNWNFILHINTYAYSTVIGELKRKYDTQCPMSRVDVGFSLFSVGYMQML